jgi:hypothetical protein
MLRPTEVGATRGHAIRMHASKSELTHSRRTRDPPTDLRRRDEHAPQHASRSLVRVLGRLALGRLALGVFSRLWASMCVDPQVLGLQLERCEAILLGEQQR